MFGGEEFGQLVDVGFDQALPFEHDAGAALGIGCGPGGEGLAGGFGGARDFLLAAEGDLRLHLSGVGIVDVAETV